MEVSKNDRLINYFLDTTIIIVLSTILQIIVGTLDLFLLSPIIVFGIYYFTLEITINRTVGKFLTRTKVVTSKNKRPNALHILMRTILRFVSPLDTISYLTGGTQGIHDVLSRTKLVKIEREV